MVVKPTIRLEQANIDPRAVKEGVKIIWQGGRIARLIFASGKIVQFDKEA